MIHRRIPRRGQIKVRRLFERIVTGNHRGASEPPPMRSKEEGFGSHLVEKGEDNSAASCRGKGEIAVVEKSFPILVSEQVESGGVSLAPHAKSSMGGARMRNTKARGSVDGLVRTETILIPAKKWGDTEIAERGRSVLVMRARYRSAGLTPHQRGWTDAG